MKIQVKNEKARKELKAFLNFYNRLSIKSINVKKHDMLGAFEGHPTMCDLSSRKSYSFRKFNFKHRIYINPSVTYVEIKTNSPEEFADLAEFLAYFADLKVVFNLSKDSSMIFDGEKITNRKGTAFPMRDKTDAGYGLLRMATFY